MQPLICAVLISSTGKSKITENIFENRFKYTEELKKMGANIVQKEKTIEILGSSKIEGNVVTSKDLRGGAALVIAGLMAEGETLVEDAKYILRGYESLDEKLRKLGAEIIKIYVNNEEKIAI